MWAPLQGQGQPSRGTEQSQSNKLRQAPEGRSCPVQTQRGRERRKNRREIWHLPKCHPIKSAAQSGERGNSRRPNPNGYCEEEPAPPSLAGRGWGSCQQMKAGSCRRTPGVNEPAQHRLCPRRCLCTLQRARGTPLLAPQVCPLCTHP